jgi:hypothetical protein
MAAEADRCSRALGKRRPALEGSSWPPKSLLPFRWMCQVGTRPVHPGALPATHSPLLPRRLPTPGFPRKIPKRPLHCAQSPAGQSLPRHEDLTHRTHRCPHHCSPCPLLLADLTAASRASWLPVSPLRSRPPHAHCTDYTASRRGTSGHVRSRRLQRRTQAAVCSGFAVIPRPVNLPPDTTSMTQQE